MLGKPEHGWTQISIGDFSDQAGDLTDVPMDCLKAFIYGLSTGSPIALSFNAEGWEYLIVVDFYYTHIISDKDQFTLLSDSDDSEREFFGRESYMIKYEDLAFELIDDIESNLEGWVQWGLFMDDGVNSAERRKELVDHVNILKGVLEKRERRSEQFWKKIMDLVKGPIEIVEVSNNEELQAHLNRNADKC